MSQTELSDVTVAQARERIVGALAEDMASNCIDGEVETTLLVSWFREGVRGFCDFTNIELLEALTDAGLDERYQRESDILRSSISPDPFSGA